MKTQIKNNIIEILGNEFCFDDIDFILMNGKIRVYLKDGQVSSVNAGFSNNDTVDCFRDIIRVLSHNRDFIRFQDKTIVNMNNISNICYSVEGLTILTKGFSMRFNDVKKDQYLEMKREFDQKYCKNELYL